MTRIIAGFAGSLTLAVPRSGTRPTSDRVREAIFSALDARDAIEGAVVLDLYAGSGALGLEAGSRGAAEVVLVERARPAAEVCRRNAAALAKAARGGTTPRVRVEPRSVAAYLEAAAPGVDLAFVDPPYDLGEADLARDLALLAPSSDPTRSSSSNAAAAPPNRSGPRASSPNVDATTARRRCGGPRPTRRISRRCRPSPNRGPTRRCRPARRRA
ncbi:hypothetical protein GCM10025870_31870 [Agromyces marinus]|uniref:16S rRNA (Guanine966-N2)-methyltransferase n=1 Tax=Agromyces marinus TaxID=1389020 RepID=A0ABM8H5T3_9MICO|nr:hypothetical protein GCM10025870_31870 [Agromyces marinus]